MDLEDKVNILAQTAIERERDFQLLCDIVSGLKERIKKLEEEKK